MSLLQTRALTRTFPGVVALDRVDFAADGGEVHAICGANGAGKSTLMNVLSGTIRPTSGAIELDGRPVRFAAPADAAEAGIAIVYQELSAIPELTVADNIYLGREFTTRFGGVDRGRARIAAGQLLKRYGIDLQPDALVGDLGVADHQLVELARALASDARILILDEPTAVLSIAEQTKLFHVINLLRTRGLLVLYISHRLEEIFEIADRVSVMRDGRLVATCDKSKVTPAELVRMMTDRDVAPADQPDPPDDDAPEVLALHGLTADGATLSIRAGEIVGLAGLVGAGRTSIAHRIAGLRPRTGFEVTLDGKPLADSVRQVLDSGVVYLTEDRKRNGLFAPLSIITNTSAAAMNRFGFFGLLNLAKERAEASVVLNQLQVIAASPDAAVAKLSGGNQQKVLFARALLAKPRVLICDEPTRGVDVGAREEIYKILRSLSRQGVTIILISSELEEILALSHRIAVVRHGRITTVIDNRNVDEHALLIAATGAETAEQGIGANT